MIYRNLIQLVAACLLTAPLLAQPIPRQTNPSQTQSSQSNPHPSAPLTKDFQKRFTHINKRYKLTAVQQSEVRSILLKEQLDRQTVSSDGYMSGRDKQEEQASLFEASQQKIGAILNRQQKRKFDADEKRRAWMDGRLPNPNPGPAWR